MSKILNSEFGDFIVLKVSDIKYHLSSRNILALNSYIDVIEKGNAARGIEPKEYIVIDPDKAYANDILEIIKKYEER